MLQLIEYTGNWRKSWTAILEHQAHLAAALVETYQDIPGSNRPEGPAETPAEVLDRTAGYAQVQHDIKVDLATDIAFVERAVIGPLMEGKSYLKPIMKYIQKRDDKKLDYEKYYKLVENYKAKPNPSKREASILAKGELDLEEATIVRLSHQQGDGHTNTDRHTELLMTLSERRFRLCSIASPCCFQ
jgi:hypothetical protein